MKFKLIDQVLVQEPRRVVAIKNVTESEEYLSDHFPTFPVLPGVFMVEAMVQAARVLLDPTHPRQVLGSVRALRYGSFVRQGNRTTRVPLLGISRMLSTVCRRRLLLRAHL